MNRQKRSPLLLMALTILIDFTGFGLILPLLPFWAQHLGANPIGVGLILTMYALAQFIFTPILGTLSDRYGRKPIIFSSLLIEAASLALSALAWSLPILLLARFIGGLGASNIGSAQAVVSDTTSPTDRAKGMGLIGASIGLGFVIGPALGGVLAPLGPSIPFWAATGVALLNALLVLFFLPETLQRQDRLMQTESARSNFFAGITRAMRYPVVIRLIAINLIFTVAFTAMEAIFPLFTQHTYGWGAPQNGYIFTYIGVIIVLMQGGLVGQLVKHWNEQAIMVVGLIMLAVGLTMLAFSTQLAILLVTLGILSVGEGAVTPLVSTLLSFASPTDAQGETLGLAQGMAGLGRIVGPVAAGSIYAIGGPTMPFIASGILVVLATVIAVPKMAVSRTSTAKGHVAEGPDHTAEIEVTSTAGQHL